MLELLNRLRLWAGVDRPVFYIARNISELCQSLIGRHSLKNAGEVVLAVFFIGECDFDSMGVDLSGRNFAKTIAKDSGVLRQKMISGLHPKSETISS